MPSVTALVGRFEVATYVELTDTPEGFTPVNRCVPAYQAALGAVLKLRDGMAPTVGRIVAYDVALEFESDAGGGASRYCEAIEIESTSSISFSIDGDAGAPVVTEKGDIVGIVIAVGEGLCFAAPLHSYLAEAGLVPVTRSIASRAAKVSLFEALPEPAVQVQPSSLARQSLPVRTTGVRIAGVNLPSHKRVPIALQYIYMA
jgi:hypothetical protein